MTSVKVAQKYLLLPTSSREVLMFQLFRWSSTTYVTLMMRAVWSRLLIFPFLQDIPQHHAPGQPRTADPQTYLHRIGRTGRFGRVGVAISFVSSREEWQMLMNIQKYFHTTIEGIQTRDWDDVEDLVKKIIKNPRARGDFPQTAAA